MNMMKAVCIHRFGGPEALAVEMLPIPSPVDDEVVVKVHAAGVNPVDFKIREGKFPLIKQSQLPVVTGRDASGVVEKCGIRATAFRKGDEVYAMPDFDRGTYANYIRIKPNEAALKPKTLDHAQAASVPLAGLTAWQGLFTYGRLHAGQRVLIHGGGGGVGHLAIQFAKAKGAYVITTVSGQDIEFVRSLGADEVIDYQKERFEEKIDKVNLVFDLVSGETQERSWAVLKPGSTFVSTLNEPSQHRAHQSGIRALRYTTLPNSGQLAEIAQLIDQGKVRPHVAHSYPLAQAAAAQEHIEKQHVQGKLVVVAPDDDAPSNLPALEGA